LTELAITRKSGVPVGVIVAVGVPVGSGVDVAVGGIGVLDGRAASVCAIAVATTSGEGLQAVIKITITNALVNKVFTTTIPYGSLTLNHWMSTMTGKTSMEEALNPTEPSVKRR
jgi:hypothetical protein